ncbi:MAG TPA: ABC transporter permease, partial [Candidatus Methylomirabilis sp.]|nr:ABC transporter permease [Candidatus Methylomirabilis sp.]
VIGIASVILMLSVGQAAQSYLLSQVAAFGSDLVIVTNGRGDEMETGPPDVTQKLTLTYDDYKRLKRETWVRNAAASVMSTDVVTYGPISKFVSVGGSTPDEPIMFNSEIDRGRFIQDDDVNSYATVIVLGAGIADDLFGEQDPIGHQVKINKRNFRVIGVMKHAGARFFSEPDEEVYIPVTSALRLYNKDRLNFIMLKATTGVNEAKELVRVTLRESHNLNNPKGVLSKDDFRVATQEDAVRNAGIISNILQILLASVAAISLLVGGIGIMNIMYVNVTERTHEIGLRKALGAKRNDVMNQFLAEAVFLTLMGGVIGVATGLALSWAAIQIILQFQGGWSFILPWNGIVLGFSVSFAIGLLFGFFPARKASRLHPIEALRFE